MLLMHHWVGEGFVAADAEGKGADGGAGVALLIFIKKRPGERYWTFCVVRKRSVADGTLVN